MHFTDLVFATFPVSGFLSTSVSHSVSLVLLCLRLLLLAGRGLRQPKPKPVKPLSSSWCDGVATSKLLGNILVWPKALIVALLSPLSLALSTAPAADDCSKNGGVWPLAHFAAAFSGILWPLRRNWHLLRNLSPSPCIPAVASCSQNEQFIARSGRESYLLGNAAPFKRFPHKSSHHINYLWSLRQKMGGNKYCIRNCSCITKYKKLQVWTANRKYVLRS